MTDTGRCQDKSTAMQLLSYLLLHVYNAIIIITNNVLCCVAHHYVHGDAKIKTYFGNNYCIVISKNKHQFKLKSAEVSRSSVKYTQMISMFLAQLTDGNRFTVMLICIASVIPRRTHR